MTSTPNPSVDRVFDRIQILLNQYAVTSLYEFYDVATAWANSKHRINIQQVYHSILCALCFVASFTILEITLFGSSTWHIEPCLGICGSLLFAAISLDQVATARNYGLRRQILREIDFVRRQQTVRKQLQAAAGSAIALNTIGGPHDLLRISIKISENLKYFREVR